MTHLLWKLKKNIKHDTLKIKLHANNKLSGTLDVIQEYTQEYSSLEISLGACNKSVINSKHNITSYYNTAADITSDSSTQMILLTYFISCNRNSKKLMMSPVWLIVYKIHRIFSLPDSQQVIYKY